MRSLLRSLSRPTTLVDFEEALQLPSFRDTARLWFAGQALQAFAYVDDYNNLWFEAAEEPPLEIRREIVAWAAGCVLRRDTDPNPTLDAVLDAGREWQIRLLEEAGFQVAPLRTLRFARSLEGELPEADLPDGFSLRAVKGEEEAQELVALHRSAFGSEQMTVETRLAMMRTPHYDRRLDLLAIAPDRRPAAFCVCAIDENDPRAGTTDPIGVHPDWRGRGLGRSITAAGLRALQTRGVLTVSLGTASDNLPMRGLAERLGFALVAEKVWFTKELTVQAAGAQYSPRNPD